MILLRSVMRLDLFRGILRCLVNYHTVAPFIVVLAGCASNPIATAPNHDPSAVLVPADPVSLVEQKLSEDLGQLVVVSLSTNNSDGEWTFMAGRPTTQNGSRIDYAKTQYAEAWADGYFDDHFVALVKIDESGVDQRLVAYDLGSTDAPFVSWPEQYGVPSGLVFSD